jgi:hypothetical protein
MELFTMLTKQAYIGAAFSHTRIDVAPLVNPENCSYLVVSGFLGLLTTI